MGVMKALHTWISGKGKTRAIRTEARDGAVADVVATCPTCDYRDDRPDAPFRCPRCHDVMVGTRP